MDIQSYATFQGSKNRKKRRRIIGVIIIIVILLCGLFTLGILTSDGPEYQLRQSIIEENHALKEQIAELEDEIHDLEKELKQAQSEPLPTEDITEPTAPRD